MHQENLSFLNKYIEGEITHGRTNQNIVVLRSLTTYLVQITSSKFWQFSAHYSAGTEVVFQECIVCKWYIICQ
jgi:hypothetical protein